MNYYNEFDPKAAECLRQLIKQKLIPEGIVDERSITDIRANELLGYTQCHFFAGIGGWSLALQLAGWSSDRKVWTGSCPCQAFSTAGKQQGFSDERDLWPVFFNLIRECRPEFVFGEQVENAIRHNWLDRVYTDLEVQGYAVGATVLGAHSVGSPHRRYRLYWGGALLGGLADLSVHGCAGCNQDKGTDNSFERGLCEPQGKSNVCGLADTESDGRNSRRPESDWRCASSDGGIVRMADGNSERLNWKPVSEKQKWNEIDEIAGSSKYCIFCDEWYPESSWEWSDGKCPDCGMADADIAPCKGLHESCGIQSKQFESELPCISNLPWQSSIRILCRDNKIRRIPAESLLFGVADGLSGELDESRFVGISDVGGFPLTTQKEGRPMLLKGYGNAIVPQVAAEWIMAFDQSIKELT